MKSSLTSFLIRKCGALFFHFLKSGPTFYKNPDMKFGFLGSQLTTYNKNFNANSLNNFMHRAGKSPTLLTKMRGEGDLVEVRIG